jgi:hypothetical protein
MWPYRSGKNEIECPTATHHNLIWWESAQNGVKIVGISLCLAWYDSVASFTPTNEKSISLAARHPYGSIIMKTAAMRKSILRGYAYMSCRSPSRLPATSLTTMPPALSLAGWLMIGKQKLKDTADR